MLERLLLNRTQSSSVSFSRNSNGRLIVVNQSTMAVTEPQACGGSATDAHDQPFKSNRHICLIRFVWACPT